jgi:hypothetical protein
MPPFQARPNFHVATNERAAPTEKQKQIWEIIRRTKPGSRTFIGYGGAAGGGKTRGIVELAVDLAEDYPGNKILVGRKDFKDLNTTTLEQFVMHCPPSLIAEKNLNEHWYKIRKEGWPPGVYSTIIFRELKDYIGLGSEEYGAVLIDEAGEVPRNSALFLLSRMRWQLPDIIRNTPPTPETPWGRKGRELKRIFMAASNPWPGWFEEWFVKRTLDEEALRALDGTIHYIPSLPKDNPYLPDDYEATLRALWPEDWVRRLMEGRWDAFVGQVYPMFSQEAYPLGHCYRATLPDKKEWVRVIGGLDFGGQNPFDHYSTGIVAIELKSGRIIRVAEFEERGKNVYDRQLAWMLTQEAQWCTQQTGPRIWWVADRSQGLNIQNYQRLGFKVRASKGGHDSVDHGIAQVARRFEKDGNGYPGSAYLPSLTQFPQRVAAYHYVEPAGEETEARRHPTKRNNDLLDADRYMHELLGETFGQPAPNQFPVLQSPPSWFGQSHLQWSPSNREMMNK